MLYHKNLSYILFFILVCASVNIFAADDKLLFSVDLIRHGDRNPLYQIPKSEIEWKRGLGELTTKGESQQRELGRALRTRYINQTHLLPSLYDPSTLYVRSTQISRTINSAHSLLLGLYPLNKRAGKEIPIHVVPKNDDHLLLTKPSHNIFALVKRYVRKNSFWQETMIYRKAQLKYWSELSGVTLNNAGQLNRLADNLYVRRIHQLPLPAGMKINDAEEIIALNEMVIANDFKMKELTEPMGRRFLKTVLTYFKASSLQGSPLKYVLYLGHDSSIMSVMNTLRVPLNGLPSYASRLNFSLVERENQLFVKINFNDKPVTVPFCKNNLCTLSQFEAYTSR